MSRKLDTSLHKTVRIYVHTTIINPNSGACTHAVKSHSFRDRWSEWIGHLNQLRNQGLHIVGLGSEGGAMVVHFA